jgi:hypothetical protein
MERIQIFLPNSVIQDFGRKVKDKKELGNNKEVSEYSNSTK